MYHSVAAAVVVGKQSEEHMAHKKDTSLVADEDMKKHIVAVQGLFQLLEQQKIDQ